MAELYPAEDLYPGEALYPGEGPESEASNERIAVTREFPSDQLAVRISPPNGAPSRWAADEALAENVIADHKFSGELNGGEKEMAGTLARDPRLSFSDLTAFSDVEVYGPGVNTVWRGRLDKAPETDGDHMSIDPAAVGHRAALEDNKGITAGFINKSLPTWTGPGIQRRLALINGNAPHRNDPAVVPDATTPTLRLTVGDAWASPTTPRCEAWFDAGPGIRIGRVVSDYSGWPDAAFILERRVSDDDQANGSEGSADLFSGSAGTDDYTPAVPKRYLRYGWHYASTPAGVDGSEYAADLANLTVVADHGLALQGTWPDVGFTAKQMLAHVISRHTYLEVDEDDLEDDEFVIPQAWFSDPTTVLAIVEELTKYGLLHWFVRGKKFYYRFPGTYGRRWQAYAGPSALREQGLDASRLWRSIVVRYQDVDGSSRTVGPPGSGASAEDAGLEITDPDHPAVRAGITRQDILDLGVIASRAQAIATGERWLEEANLLSRSGSCTLSYYAMDDRGVFRPVSQIREGDLVRFPDAHDRSYRTVVSYEYTHASRSNNLSLDAPKESIIALLARYGAKLESLGVG